MSGKKDKKPITAVVDDDEDNEGIKVAGISMDDF
jgi:hypothetical protein